MSSSSRSKKKGGSPPQHPWSEWEWYPEHNRYIRSRQNDSCAGGYEWDYSKPGEAATAEASASAASQNPDVPRYTPPSQVEGTQETSYTSPQSYAYNNVEGLTNAFASTGLSSASSGAGEDKGKQAAGDKKGKQPGSAGDDNGKPTANNPTPLRGAAQPFASQFAAAERLLPDQTQSEYDFKANPTPFMRPKEGYEKWLIDSFLDKGSAHQYANFYSGSGFSPAPPNYNRGTLNAHYNTDPNLISGSSFKKNDVLDAEFKIHHSKEFKRFKVFKMVWHETRGENNTFGTDTIYGKYKQAVNASIRRFIVYTSHEGHSLCFPILTYGKQGTTKPGLHPEHHGMIYNGESAPPLLPNEKPLAIPAVRMILQSGRKVEHLDPASRVNYAKIYTVEHNVKCVIIGSIDEDYRDIIRAQHKNFHKT